MKEKYTEKELLVFPGMTSEREIAFWKNTLKELLDTISQFIELHDEGLDYIDDYDREEYEETKEYEAYKNLQEDSDYCAKMITLN